MLQCSPFNLRKDNPAEPEGLRSQSIDLSCGAGGEPEALDILNSKLAAMPIDRIHTIVVERLYCACTGTNTHHHRSCDGAVLGTSLLYNCSPAPLGRQSIDLSLIPHGKPRFI